MTTKLAISVPDELFEHIERIRQRTGETRSGLAQRALQRVVTDEARMEAVRAYVDGYRRAPEDA
nr:hypothetical protein [Deltaproteobacteria bacterium]